ncbi:MAG: thioredoxin family protein [Holosporales bacterium]|jgi:thiol:disulfide interchange protein DsbD|nr:thioredoxin family protein [Holosporales bacterium]
MTKKGFFAFLLILLFSVTHSSYSCSIRSYRESFSENLWISFDFYLKTGERIASSGQTAPSFDWKNANVLKKLSPHTDTYYVGDSPNDKTYHKDFSVLFNLKKQDRTKPVECELFYVVCWTSCRPVLQNFTIDEVDNLLGEQEIKAALNEEQMAENTAIPFVLLMVFVGGILLNCMPCVFPIISLKIFSIIKNSNSSRKSIVKEGMYFTSGIIATFILIGLVLFLLKKTGENLGWGFYMQNQVFVAFLGAIFLISALYFFGIIKPPNITLPSGFRNYKSFTNGVFTGIVSGICVGPFVGMPLALALSFSNLFVTFFVLTTFGFGVASPFLLLSLIPGMNRFWPKPGKWMENLKEFMGFSMLFSCFWTFSILFPGTILTKYLFIILVLALLFWAFTKVEKSKTIKVILISIALGVIYIIFDLEQNKGSDDSTLIWQNFSLKELEKHRIEGRPVFVNFTASWCSTCLYNEPVFKKKEIIDFFKTNKIIVMKADWTRKNDEISKTLKSLGYNSVPLYVFYGPGSKAPVILPVLISVNDIKGSIEK